jgi:homoserine dehydrogenase
VNTVNVILMGAGNVGKAFIRLVLRKSKDCAERYGLRLRLVAVFNSKGGLLLSPGAAAGNLVGEWDSDLNLERNPFWKPGRILEEALESHEAGILADCTPSNIETGEPGLLFVHRALDRGWHVVTASKGALVVDYANLRHKAEKNRLSLGLSGATAAALPALDVALYCLAGTEIHRIEGILNGTTNYILTRMIDGADYEKALEEAQRKGIAEPDPSQDLEGWDTAAKILIITNAVFRTEFVLDDVCVEGITHISSGLLQEAKKKSKSLKLVGSFHKDKGIPKLEARLYSLDPSHPLYGVNDTQKGITFLTDTMNSVTVTGGKSDPKGAAAALLKDIINIAGCSTINI